MLGERLGLGDFGVHVQGSDPRDQLVARGNRHRIGLGQALEQRFEAELRKLTRSEGQILCKLVYRETNQTVFQLIREYRNWFTAVGWSVTGSWYDINIRKEYEPGENQEDALIEKILKRAFALGDLKERVPMDVNGTLKPRR